MSRLLMRGLWVMAGRIRISWARDRNVASPYGLGIGILGGAGVADEVRPMFQPVPGILHGSGQDEVPQLLADDFRVKEWFGFDGHGLAGELGWMG